MKKLRLSNIFHWLYAFLMFAPLFIFLYFFITYAFQGYFVEDIFTTMLEYVHGYSYVPEFGGIMAVVTDMFNYLGINVLGIDVDASGSFAALSLQLCSYWVCVSFIYLVFDIVMFPINLAHRWIDKGGLE